MKAVTFAELSKYIEAISDSRAFELAALGDDFVVPYILNDSIEDYFVFKNCSIRGDYDPDLQEDTTAEAVTDGGLTGLIIRQANTNVVTLWYEAVFRVQKCSRYHEIGHFWAKGFEHWRRIVYMAGTLHDKFTYGGEAFCNEKELELLPLIEFAPLREFSYFKEGIHQFYADTYEAVNLMREMAMEVGDVEFVKRLMAYEKRPSLRFARRIARKMNAAKRAPLYEQIYSRLCEASAEHPPRDYGETRNAGIVRARETVTEKLRAAGYEGAYPRFTRGNRQVLAAEEHPFTLSEMEYHDFEFRIRFMVSDCRKPPKHLCQGFFRGFGSKGRIEEDIEKLL
ncbi:MAG: DUF3878 family protein [Clostridia bacterium]|nr:DUF3878 family protein [Clostridia bacterium]